jgi:glutathione synthase/RimK-type ligase-like ATP-grasp enzyme
MKDFNVGLLYFSNPFGDDLQNRLNNLEPFYNIENELIKVKAEHVSIHEVDIDYQTKYNMIIDRGSHIFKQGIGILMTYAFKGIYIINNPLSFHFFIDNKDVGYSIASALGINVPKTYILPPHTTPHFKPEDFKYHKLFNWEKILDDIGFPCVIKPAAGRAAFNVNIAHNFDELIYYYNQSGETIMTVQKFVKSNYNWQIRCLCIGKEILPIKYIFRKMDASEYLTDKNFLTKEQEEYIINCCKIINRAFGYEMNSVEFFIDEEGIPWAIDFNNPIPDGRKHVLGEFYEFYQNSLVKRVIEVAKNEPKYLFLPNLNVFSEIAQMNTSKKNKFNLALNKANEYYLNDTL